MGSLDLEEVEAVVPAPVGEEAKVGGVAVAGRSAVVGEEAGDFENAPQEEIRSIWETNVFGPMRLVKAVVPSMREAGSGSILNVSSVASRVASPGMSMYAASKAALSAFSVVLAGELAPFGIRVAAIEPGFYATPILEKAVSTLAPDGSDHADAERRLAMVFAQAAPEAENPTEVDQVMVDTVAAEQLEELRIVVGESGRQFARGGENLSDQDFLHLCSAETDEEYFGLFAEAFPPLP